MKYFDSGSRNPDHTLASWLANTLNEDVFELRLQTGFFSLDGIGLLLPALEKCKQDNQLTKILIGSNDASTLKDDVIGLATFLGIPREGAHLGVVNFGGAFFHPKTYHVTRHDGSQAAFVGSANLTSSGLALHVEAGITLDTNDGDAPFHLSQIASAIDNWFTEQRAGMTLVSDLRIINELAESGVLSLTRPPRTESEDRDSPPNGNPARPRLRRLFQLPIVSQPVDQPTAQTAAAITSSTPPSITVPAIPTPPSVLRNGFPSYLLFQPSATGPTSNALALTGTPLHAGSQGLIIQLNKDSARHFMGRIGTANISIPVATVPTFRFGVSGTHNRPTVKFDLHLRHVSDTSTINGQLSSTNIMGYGYTATENGHGDIRMLVPASVKALGEQITAAGKTKPTIDDLAFLEWPTLQNPAFRLTFIDTQSAIYQQAVTTFNLATAGGQLVGKGACWLNTGISPSW